ncbi:putative agmatine deiminase [Nematostella vectensis]|uniref:putative agmatine deiminase n=1 Tax=Nematostella vectensis TaxID=45351 RepID=UPI0013900A13|nr:putative agmatine deiminase [Nematostella vectensis]
MANVLLFGGALCLLSVIACLAAASNEDEKQVIVLSMPGESYGHYYDLKTLEKIAEFIKEMDQKTFGRDDLFVVHDDTGLKPRYLGNYNFINAKLIKVPVGQTLDLWMRDFPPAMPKQQIKFKYDPDYLKETDKAKTDTVTFKRFAEMIGIPPMHLSDIVIEGGNIVENGKDIAITTARIYNDNPSIEQAQLVRKLENEINRTVVVLDDPKDTTGHSDGLVSFVDENTLLISMFDDADAPRYYSSMEKAVTSKFPNVTVVPLPCYTKKDTEHGFKTAEGSYANSLVTNNAVYVAMYANQAANAVAERVFRDNTPITKEVIPVYKAGEVPILGGSVRCMSWQIDRNHPVAQALISYVEKL